MKIGERARDTLVAILGKRAMCIVHVFCKKAKMTENGAISGMQRFRYSIFRKLVVAFLTKRLYDKNVHGHGNKNNVHEIQKMPGFPVNEKEVFLQ